MAANRFTATLSRNTDRMTVILVHAVLEWTLILMLLLNGVFSYLIARFAAYFGLRPPCVFCARVDHLFEPEGRRRRGSACRDLVCEDHAAEVAGLGYCNRHRRLAEAEEMCEDCCSASSSLRSPEAALLSWMKRSEEGEKDLTCSCCGVALESGFYSPYLLLKPSRDASEHNQPKGSFIEQFVAGDREDLEEDAASCPKKVETEEDDEEKVGREDAACALVSDREVEEEEALIHFDGVRRLVSDASLEVLTWHPGNTWDDERLVPIELIDSSTKRPAVFLPSEEDLIELEHVGGVEEDGVVDIGSITEERKLVFSAAERIGIIKESSEFAEGEQAAKDFDIQVTMEEEKELVSSTNMTDIVEVNPVEDGGLFGEEMVLHVGLIVTARADTMEDNCYEVDDAQKGSSALDMTEMEDKPFNSAECKAEPVEGSSSLDMGGVSDEEKPLLFVEHMADAIEDSSCEADDDQKGAIALRTERISMEEDALASVECRADGTEDNLKDMDDTKLCAVRFDTGNVPQEEHKLQKCADLPALELISECSSGQESIPSQGTPTAAVEADAVIRNESLIYEDDPPETKDFEEDIKLVDLGDDCEISIGSEICQQEHVGHTHLYESIIIPEIIQGQLSEGNNSMQNIDQETVINETEPVIAAAKNSAHIAASQQNNETEEERAPPTPTHVNGIYGLNKRFLFGKRESGTESLDGSVASEFDGCETFTVDQLKAALESERKALSALYAELEEERSSSAIAANQTMAMITRLQEEKAAMQMEALQYQRMMEEQSEYDQEALHLLNELMMKREKENQELEKELEMYRKRVHHYEAKERRQMAKQKINSASGTSSTSSSAGDSDDLLFDSHDKDGFSYDENNQNTPADDVLGSGTDQGTTKHLITLKESLADFEAERLSILEQLRILERKLITLDDEEPHNLEAIEHIPDENGCVSNGHYESLSDDLEDYVNGFSDNLGASRKLHREGRNMGCQAKRLLPLFDAISDENEDDVCTKEEAVGASPQTISNIVEEQNKLAIVEEIDSIYERLDALEGDREFLKHCVNSLKKGDKGIQLLQEILEHLRDLRSVEVRARNSCDTFAQ